MTRRGPAWRPVWILAGLLGAGLGAAWWLHAGAGPARPIAVVFMHRDHAAYNCVQCHHDILDPALAATPASPPGARTCIGCHRTRPDLAVSILPTFHDFCEGCHLARRRDHSESGPVRLCHGCHIPPAGRKGQDIF